MVPEPSHDPSKTPLLMMGYFKGAPGLEGEAAAEPTFMSIAFGKTSWQLNLETGTAAILKPNVNITDLLLLDLFIF